MKRRRRGRSAPPVRLPEEVTTVVKRLAENTGWSESASLAFLANAGWNAIGGKGEKIDAFQQFMHAAIDHHDASAAVKQKLALTSSKLRAAKKALAAPTCPALVSTAMPRAAGSVPGGSKGRTRPTPRPRDAARKEKQP